MSAVATRTRPILVRRLRDEDGQLVTYLPNAQLCDVVSISPTTLNAWKRQDLVRTTDVLNGGRNYAVVDAARIKLMTVRESLALGLHRTPKATLVVDHARWHRKQDATIPTADHANEQWDDYDLEFVINMVTEGYRLVTIARALGRTYAAVSAMSERLRDSGDLPRDVEDAGWRERVVELLTPAEVATLLERRA